MAHAFQSFARTQTKITLAFDLVYSCNERDFCHGHRRFAIQVAVAGEEVAEEEEGVVVVAG